MGFLDVLSGKQSVGSWLTGRDEKESDVYQNFEMVETVTTKIRQIGKSSVGNAQDAIYSAISSLNSVNGLAEYVGTVNASNYDGVFESLTTTICSIADQLENKANDIKIYEEASWLEKLGSSVAMGTCKLFEGVFSAVEDIGDGIVSIAGWGAGVLGATEFQKDCANFVQKEWSHDMFNFYYESDFAKMSTFTEDSAIAGACKLTGKVAAYLYAGGFMAGATGLSGASTALKAGQTVGKVAGTMLKVASSSTWGATMAGALGGLGSGTEAGLNSLDVKDFESFTDYYNAAHAVGRKQAVVQGALAFAGGKVQEIGAAAKAGNQGLAAIKNSASYQGYTDALTQAGTRFGEATRSVVSNGVTALKASASSSVANLRGDATAGIKGHAADEATATFKDSLRELAHENPLAQGARGLQAAGSSAWNAVTHPGETLKNAGSSAWQGAKTAVTHPISTAVKGVAAVAKNPTTYVAAGTVLNETVASEGRAALAARQAQEQNPMPTPQGPDFNDEASQNIITAIEDYKPEVQTITGDGSSTGGTSGGTTTGGGGGGYAPVPTTPGTPPATIPDIIPGTTPDITPGTTPDITPGTTPGTPPSDDSHGGVGFDGSTFTSDGESGSDLANNIGNQLDDLLGASSIDDILNAGSLKLPSTTKPITSSGKTQTSVVPIAAGLSAASAAGIGAKAYMDYKKSNETDEDSEEDEYDEYSEDDEFEMQDWENADNIELSEEEVRESTTPANEADDDDENFHESESVTPIIGGFELQE